MRIGIGVDIDRSGGGAVRDPLPLLIARFTTGTGETLDTPITVPALTSWTLQGVTRTPGQADPLGGTAAILIEDDGTDGLHRITTTTSGGDSGQTASITVYIKPAPANDVNYLLQRTTNGYDGIFNIVTRRGTIGTFTECADIGGGWTLFRTEGSVGNVAGFQLVMEAVNNVTSWNGALYTGAWYVYAPIVDQSRLTSWASSVGAYTAAEATNAPRHTVPGVRFDGTAHVATTTVSPSAEGTCYAWIRRDWNDIDVRAIMGAEVGANLLALGLDANHYPVAQLGTDTVTTIKGDDGDDVSPHWTFLALSWDAGSVRLVSSDGQTATEVYAGSVHGAVPTGRPYMLGAINDDGTADTRCAMWLGECGFSTERMSVAELLRLATATKPATLETFAPDLPATITVVAGSSLVLRDEDLVPRGVVSASGTCPHTKAAGTLTLSPTVPGTTSLTVTNTTAAGAASTVVAVVAVAAANPTLNVVVVGDSISAAGAGYWIDTVADALSNVTLLGTQTTAGSHLSEGFNGAKFEGILAGTYSTMCPGGVPDIATYLTTIGGTPDVVIWALGTNDVFDRDPHLVGGTDAAQRWVDVWCLEAFDAFDTLLAAWAAEVPGAVHVLALPCFGNARQSAFDLSYNGRQQDRWAFDIDVRRYWEMAIARYGGGAVELVPLGAAIDRTAGYSSGNAVHPIAAGGAQMAQPLVHWIQGV